MQNVPDFLLSHFPNADIKFIGSGSDSDAFRVGTKIIRVPHQNSGAMYERESKICHAIAKYISIRIPNITVHTDGGNVWVEHEMITGDKWSWHKFMWNRTKTRNLGQSIARFMAELHGMDTKKLCRAVPELKQSAPYMEFDAIAPYLATVLSNRQMKTFRKNYERILNFPVKPSDMVLVHLGIKGPNSVVDSNANLSGVFDFCNAGIYERERDMVLIAMLAPHSLWRAFAHEYRRITGIKPNKKRIYDLMKIEFLWSKRWISTDGGIIVPNMRFFAKNVGAAMARFYHIPTVCKWWWYYRAKYVNRSK